MKINILVLNYNGRELLKECLPSIIIASRNSKHSCSVTVLDNKSTDDSVKFLKEEFPEVRIYSAKENRFLCSFNEVAESSDADILVLLNSDIKIDKDFVDPLIDIFNNHSDAFMAGPQCWTFDSSQYEGTKTKIRMKFGFFQAFSRYPGFLQNIKKPGYTASAGSVVAFRRDRFLELGGYDDLYLPGRLEDVDLCYRGWKRGYKAYYVPQSMAYHKGLASFGEYLGYKRTITIAYRNTFLFIWKNITDAKLLLKHIIFLIPWLLFSFLKLNFSFIFGFFQAIPKLTKAVSKRNKEVRNFKKTDTELLNLLGWKRSRLSL